MAARRAGPSKVAGSGVFLDRLALDEQALAGVERVEGDCFLQQGGGFGLDLEQLGDEFVQMRAEGDDEVGFVLVCQAVGGGSGGQQTLVQGGVLGLQRCQELFVEADQAVAVAQVGEAEVQAETVGLSHFGYHSSAGEPMGALGNPRSGCHRRTGQATAEL